MSNRVAAVIPAAGLGTRMGGNFPKQYLKIGGVPLLVYPLRILDAIEAITEIILAVPEADLGYCQDEIVQGFGVKKVSQVVAGGRRRQDSVRNALSAVTPSPEFVLVHDAARPFVTVSIVKHALETAYQIGGAVVAIPMPDTVKRVDATGRIQETLRRDPLWLIQTPQVFRFSWLVEAHQFAETKGLEVTDDAALIEQLGYPVSVVQGSSTNIKITRPEDLQLGEAILASQHT
ncbi:MAG: 2-C-methyl-D-erythritol 4-phosphate cytidylyltransferase [Nitrospirota bacterium]|nr:MAG: 2-C-methyl-D-erythritol 4-phosphate cytidylyltransferase [Nitrospirota bacterium]